MLKLMKYEFRKLRLTLGIMLGVLAALEIAFIVGNAIHNDALVGVSLGLMAPLGFAVFLYILVAGIASYSRELNSKTGYLAFMTPVSPAGIVASKLVFVIAAAFIVAALFGAVLYFDIVQLLRGMNFDPRLYRQAGQFIDSFLGEQGTSLAEIAHAIVSGAASVVIGIMTVTCTAYLAITLSATLLENRRGFIKGLLSVVFFFTLQYAASFVTDRLIGDSQAQSMAEVAGYLGRSLAMQLGFCALYGGAAALLLDRRVSL